MRAACGRVSQYRVSDYTSDCPGGVPGARRNPGAGAGGGGGAELTTDGGRLRPECWEEGRTSKYRVIIYTDVNSVQKTGPNLCVRHVNESPKPKPRAGLRERKNPPF